MRGLSGTLSPWHQKGKRKCIEGFIFKFNSKGYRYQPDFSAELENSLHSLPSAVFFEWANFFMNDTFLTLLTEKFSQKP